MKTNACSVIHPKFGPCVETGPHGDQHRPHRYALPAQETLGEAAKRLGVTASTLRVQIKNGKLRSTKRGRDHWITEGEIERYRRESQGHATSSKD